MGVISFQLYFLSLFFLLFFFLLLTIARSRVLDFQQHPHRAGGLLHGTFAGVCGVVAGTHRLIGPALWTGIHADRAAAPARPVVPQTLLSCAACDGLTRLGLWTDTQRNKAENAAFRRVTGAKNRVLINISFRL